jgi:DNA polymerase I
VVTVPLQELVPTLLGLPGRDRVLATVVGPLGCALAIPGVTSFVETEHPREVFAELELQCGPRWLWWSRDTAAEAVRAGLVLAKCWDLAAVHRLLFGQWRADPARIWACLHDLPIESIPTLGQIGLLDFETAGTAHTDTGDLASPVQTDGHLRPEWVSHRWTESSATMTSWAELTLRAYNVQRDQLALHPSPRTIETTARSESLAELLCEELSTDGLPVDALRAEEIISSIAGQRASNAAEEAEARRQRDEPVLSQAPADGARDLRNPAQVKAMLKSIGIDVPDTRAGRLEPYRGVHPFVDALLTWRKAERIATTYGYHWLDANVVEGRLRGAWTGSDGAAGRMTAQAGLHNMPADLRPAVSAEPGMVFVHADLGQIEPRVLAAVSGDRSLIDATLADDMYSSVAALLGVDRARAKLAVLGAMYGATSGTAGEALRDLERSYPTAMRYLNDADRNGRNGIDIRTYGGRLVRMQSMENISPGTHAARSAAAAQGRYARNAVIQGAAAELFKTWAITVRGRAATLGARIVMCLHDELLVHTPAEHGTEVCALVEASLADAARFWMPYTTVRFIAEASIIENWSQAK